MRPRLRQRPVVRPKRRQPQAAGQEKKQGASSLPVGKASLIRASFESGMKPQAIARTLRISVAQVNEVLASTVKRK